MFASEVDFTKDEIHWIKKASVIKLGADYRWPPFDFIDSHGNHTGLSSEYIKLISKKSGLKFEIYPDVWSKTLNEMKSKKLDGLTCAVKTDERKKYLNFTNPYLSVPMVIITPESNKNIKTIDDLIGKTVSLTKGSYLHEWLKTKYPKINLHLCTSSEASIEAVTLGDSDAYIGNLAVATYIMNKYLLNNLKIITKLEGFETGVSVAIDKENKILFNIIEKTLNSITDSQHQEIKSKWKKNLGSDSKNRLLKFTKKQKEWIKKHKEIRFVIDNHWKPIEYFDEKTRKFKGLSSSYIEILRKKTGINFKLIPTDRWANSVEKVNNREADLYTCVAQTDSRKKVVDFSKVYLKMPQVFVTNKQVEFIGSIKELYGQKVVMVEGYYITEMIKKEHPQIKVVEVKNITEAFKKLTTNEAVAYVEMLAIASYYIQKEGFSNLKISGMSGYESGFSMALRNDWGEEGVEIINKALNSITEEESSNIYNKWLHVEFDKEVDYTLLLQISGVLILLILASLFWNRKLSTEIKKRKIIQEELEKSLVKIERKNLRIEKILKVSDRQFKAIMSLNEELEEMTNIAQSASKTKSDFLSNMSHEIRTPMNAILGFAELLDEKIEDKKLKSFIKTIRSSGQTLLHLINDILDLSKIESGKLEIVNSRVNVQSIFEESINIFKLQADKKNLKLEFNIDKDMPDALLIDSVRLKEILINLIGNALKFTQEGYVKVVVRVDEVYEHTSKIDLTIIVEDSGIGILKSQQEKIFNIFEQTENQDTRKYGGTGLGLAISRQLASLMGGTLLVESEYGKGSSFVLSLKNIDIASLSNEELESNSNMDYNSMTFQSAVILVVDDIKENRDLVKESFYNTQIKIIEAENGKEAVQTIKEEDVNLILMDIRMPVMDGYTATKIIKEFSTVPIIALTASIMQDELKKLEGEHFDGYLRKPVSKSELFREISKYLTCSTIDIEEVKEEISITNKEDLKTFLTHLEAEVTILHNESIKTNDLSKITEFSKTLLELSSKYNIDYMKSYSELLLEKIDSFEIDSISNMLNEYESRIEELSSISKV